MEPLSTAMAAFTAVKAGVKIGKDVHGLYRDVAKAWTAIEDVKGHHNKQKNSIKNKVLSVEEEAMETFIAKKKAEDLEDQLRQIIIYSRGMNAWQELLRMRAEIKRKRSEEERAAKRRQQEMMEQLLVAFLLVCLAAVIGWIGWFVLSTKNII